ncbi:MAG TPA: hypothetical protein VFA05_07145 [Gaiellaceae bacterium]|nr:hypothetical protein [Gaiellaceae bacterium]
MRPAEPYAVVSCHVEQPLDDEVWTAFESLLRRQPGGFAVTAFMRPPHAPSGENAEAWVERARGAAALAPLGHHTHWGGPSRARPPDGVDAAAAVRAEIAWLRERAVEPRFFCGGGWYLDEPLAAALAEARYVDCTATTFRQRYLAAGAPRLQLDAPRRLRLRDGKTLLELPATHSAGMLARSMVRLPRAVHVHFHDWELADRRRRLALEALLRLLGARRRPLRVDELAALASDAPEVAWEAATLTS